MMKGVNRALLILAGLAAAVTPALAVDCVGPDGAKHCLWVQACSGSRLLSSSRAILTQLRAEKNGLPVASVFGMV